MVHAPETGGESQCTKSRARSGREEPIVERIINETGERLFEKQGPQDLQGRRVVYGLTQGKKTVEQRRCRKGRLIGQKGRRSETYRHVLTPRKWPMNVLLLDEALNLQGEKEGRP